MSCSDIFAEPMLDTDENLNMYVKQLVEFDKKGLLPKLDEERQYKVYSTKGSGFGAHKSIVLTTDDEHFLTVELNFMVVSSKVFETQNTIPRNNHCQGSIFHCKSSCSDEAFWKVLQVLQQLPTLLQ